MSFDINEIQELEKEIWRKPNEPLIRLELGKAYFLARRYSDAIDVVRGQIEIPFKEKLEQIYFPIGKLTGFIKQEKELFIPRQLQYYVENWEEKRKMTKQNKKYNNYSLHQLKPLFLA